MNISSRPPRNVAAIDRLLEAHGVKRRVEDVLLQPGSVAAVVELLCWVERIDGKLQVIAQYRQINNEWPYGDGQVEPLEARFAVEREWQFGPQGSQPLREVELIAVFSAERLAEF